MKKVLATPIQADELADIRVGDIVYLDGYLITCRDVAHRRLVENKRALPVDLTGLAIFHAGPIVKQAQGRWSMVSVGPTTSMRMERFEREFVRQTGVKLVIGKGGMGPETMAACRECKALHLVFPGGCGVVGAEAVEEIERVEWQELGMPESLWVCRVKQFGPLIVSIDTQGQNLFEQNKVQFLCRMKEAAENIKKQVGFIR